MSWHYRSPLSFPALYTSALIKAGEWINDYVIVDARATLREAQRLAADFRWFKWCIRQNAGVRSDLFSILDTYDVRTQVREDEIGFILLVVARPTKLSEFMRLNPELAEEVLYEEH